MPSSAPLPDDAAASGVPSEPTEQNPPDTAVVTDPAVGTVPAEPGTPAGSAAPPRNLAPDLARGMMLLLIAVANVWGMLYGGATGFGFRPLDRTALDRVVDTAVAFLVDDRARPMFALLYGYGLATMAVRLAARGVDRRGVRRVLRRRSLALIGLGVLHSALLFGGDILAPYGATGLIALLLVGRSTAVLMRWFWVSLVTSMLGYLFPVLVRYWAPETGGYSAGYLESMVERLAGTVTTVMGSLFLLLFLPPVLLGIRIAREGWLDRPWQHTAILRRLVLLALAANLVGNTPHALAVAGVWQPSPGAHLLVEVAHELSGLAMGLGYICLFALVAARHQEAGPGPLLRSVAAVGQRSLTSYLLQSVLLVPLLAPWALGLGGRIGTAAASGIAVLVWAISVGVAVLLDRAGRRGPFEVLLRRVAYGSPATTPRPGS